MANRLRSFIESIVYAGMKPGAQNPQDPSSRKPGLWGPLERFLSAPTPSDPLYLTNRTFGQKMRRGMLLAVPPVIVAALIMAAIYILVPKSPPPVKELSAAEVAAKVLPNFKTDISVETNKDVQVMEVHFEHDGTIKMSGSLQNKTDRLIPEAVVVFDLTDARGSQLGGITVTETNLAPGAVRKFQRDIEQKTATYALVREVHTQ
jgi:hypothetical protein